MDHWAKNDTDRKAVLLTTYRVAATYTSHYSAVRTAVGIAVFAVVYAVLLPPALARLTAGDADRSALIRSAVAAALMLLGQFFSVKLLARTNRARAVALSAQNRRDDDLLFHENLEDPGPPRHLDPETRQVWLLEPFPIFYEDLFHRFRGMRSGWSRGTGNLVYLALTGFAVVALFWAILQSAG